MPVFPTHSPWQGCRRTATPHRPVNAPSTLPIPAVAKKPDIMVARKPGSISVHREILVTMVNSKMKKKHGQAGQGRRQGGIQKRQSKIAQDGQGSTHNQPLHALSRSGRKRRSGQAFSQPVRPHRSGWSPTPGPRCPDQNFFPATPRRPQIGCRWPH
jgi:hypothetical protein